MKRIYTVRVVLVITTLMVGFTQPVFSQLEKEPVSQLLYEITNNRGIDAAVERYQELSMNDSGMYDLSEAQLNNLGYRLLQENKAADAVRIFKLNTEFHPQSINVWDSLGEGYLALWNREQAMENYRKVLQMLQNDATLPPQQKIFFRNNAETKLLEAKLFDSPDDQTLHYISYYGGIPAGKWDMQNVAKFKAEEGVKISYQANNFYRSPIPQGIAENLTGSHPADVSTGFIGGDYRRFIGRGIITDISHLWEEQGWDDVFPEALKKMSTYRGKQYFVPMAYQWNPIWYRKDIFRELDLSPPQTWQELLDLCDNLNEKGYTPFSISVQNWPPPINRWFTILDLRLNGPEFHEQVMRGEISFLEERIRNVFIHWRELFRHHAFADSSYQNNYQKGIQDLVSGKAVMYNLGEWIYESLDKQQGEKLDFFRFPEINPNVTPAEIVHTYGAFIRTNNRRKEESEELLKWLASSESQQSNVETNNRLVANIGVDQSLYSDVQKRIITDVNETEVLVPLFEMDTHPDFAQKAMAIFREFWKQPENIEQTLQELERARNQVFSTMNSEGTVDAAEPCMEDENRRQFDFWIGNWDVYVNGEKTAESHIENLLGGCMIMENYTNLKTCFAGKSMNFYDVDMGKWVQIWTDEAGKVSRYTGEMKDGKMYFDGIGTTVAGKKYKTRMEFIPQPNGNVRQIFEVSTDDGKTWDRPFDGIYRPQKDQM